VSIDWLLRVSLTSANWSSYSRTVSCLIGLTTILMNALYTTLVEKTDRWRKRVGFNLQLKLNVNKILQGLSFYAILLWSYDLTQGFIQKSLFKSYQTLQINLGYGVDGWSVWTKNCIDPRLIISGIALVTWILCYKIKFVEIYFIWHNIIGHFVQLFYC